MADQKMQLVDWLDDLCVRFIINLPQEELESVARICFQVEEAQWFYEDFIRPIDPTLPSLNLKQFCLKIFQHCPLLSTFTDEQHLAAYQDFLGYKTRVPVRGAIMLNRDMDQVLLVKGWKSSASWSFPRGKINKDEKDLDCAIREVYEETGYDLHAAGLAPNEDTVKAIDVTMREQHMRLFVFRGVPLDTYFEPKTRKEISKIEWYRLTDLPTLRKGKQGTASEGHEAHNPNKFYMVAPFLGPLKKWIHQQRKVDAQLASHEDYTEGDELPSEAYIEEQPTQLQQISATPINLVDPATELKRLLSVNAAQAAVRSSAEPSHMKHPDQRGPELSATRNDSPEISYGQSARANVPQTPLEQIAYGAPQPRTPHADHVNHSGPALLGHPPRFHAEPPGLDPRHAQPNYNTASPWNAAGMAPHSLPHDATFRQMRGFPVQNMPPVMQQQHHDRPHAPPAAFPPPMNLSQHSIGLLNAFRSPSLQQAQLLAQQPSRLATSQLPVPDNQQRSLLSLFGPSPSPVDATKAEPQISNEPPLPNMPTVPNTLPTTSNAEKSGGDASKATEVRKPSARSMISRTLPKTKKVVQPPVPVIDQENYPILGTTPPATAVPKKIASVVTAGNATTRTNKAELRALARQATRSKVSALPGRSDSRPVSRGKPIPSPEPPKVTILQRPQTEKATVSPTPPLVAVKPLKPIQPTPQETVPLASSKPAFKPQILKRGEKPPDVNVNALSLDNPPTLQENPPAAVSKSSQKDQLLSLFAQPRATANLSSPVKEPLMPNFASPSTSVTPPAVAKRFVPPQLMSRTASQTSSNHGPIGGERSRVGSNASLTTIGRQGSMTGLVGLGSPTLTEFGYGSGHLPPKTMMSRHGSLAGSVRAAENTPKTPGTPVEAKGFLMDYLNGVAKGVK